MRQMLSFLEIVERELLFGMKPILPAFSGYVPTAIIVITKEELKVESLPEYFVHVFTFMERVQSDLFICRLAGSTKSSV